MRKIILIISIVLATGAWTASTNAQEVNLVSFGNFYNPAPTIIITGVEFYEIDCDQKLAECRDNAGNVWPFGSNLNDHYVFLCPPGFDYQYFNCVRSMTLRISLVRKYSSANLRVQRMRAGVQEIFADGNFLAKSRSACGQGMLGDNTYNLDVLTSGKNHTITIIPSITSDPYCGLPPYEVTPIMGFALSATPRGR
jgi:hypothetical protein